MTRKTYYLPPKGARKVWMQMEYHKDDPDTVILEENGVAIANPTEGEVREFVKRQDELYREMYPKLCL